MFSQLMSSRRFAPLFWSQLLAALNDNLLKNALAMLVIYRLAMENGPAIGTLAGAALDTAVLSVLRARRAVRRQIRQGRRLRPACGSWKFRSRFWRPPAFCCRRVPLLFAALVLFGTLSAFFGPVKYGLLPTHLEIQRASGRQRVDRRRDVHRDPARHDRRQLRVRRREGNRTRRRRHRRDLGARLALRAAHSAGAVFRARSRRRQEHRHVDDDASARICASTNASGRARSSRRGSGSSAPSCWRCCRTSFRRPSTAHRPSIRSRSSPSRSPSRSVRSPRRAPAKTARIWRLCRSAHC